MRQVCVRVTERWANIIDEAIKEGLFDSAEEFVTVAVARLASDIESALTCRTRIDGPGDVGEVVKPCTYVIGGDEVIITDTLSREEFMEFVEGIRLSRESDDLMETYLSLEENKRGTGIG